MTHLILRNREERTLVYSVDLDIIAASGEKQMMKLGSFW